MMKIGLTVDDEELRILILEDVLADAIVIERQLRASGLEFDARWAVSKESFERELDEFTPHLVLSAPWSWRDHYWGESDQAGREEARSTQ